MKTSVDVVLLTLSGHKLKVGLHVRPRNPLAGRLALPGGVIHAQSDRKAEDSARRVLRDKISIAPPYLEQLYTFTGTDRDTGNWSISISYYAVVPETVLEPSGNLQLHDVDALPELAFDHNEIVDMAVSRVRNKAQYSTLPLFLLPERFTVHELQQTYEAVLGEPLDKTQFRRRVQQWNALEATGETTVRSGGAPATLYRRSANALAGLTYFDRSL
ncbi:NUDIX hydrolase [Paraburkholderia sp. UCT31]|nr:NUDIX hydrolase [Paraburkholderia sp. UCT31]